LRGRACAIAVYFWAGLDGIAPWRELRPNGAPPLVTSRTRGAPGVQRAIAAAAFWRKLKLKEAVIPTAATPSAHPGAYSVRAVTTYAFRDAEATRKGGDPGDWKQQNLVPDDSWMKGDL
jgi:hypothetical protein